MGKTEGFFELRTPRQLLDKLEADFVRLQSSAPISAEAQYAAFDFFVTAEHLCDWVEQAGGTDRATLPKYDDGDLVSHVANGAKHFRVDPKRHSTVRDTQAYSGAFDSAAFQRSAFDVDRLIIEREDGRVEAVLDVAARVLEHWKKEVR